MLLMDRIPTLSIFRPEEPKSNGTAVVICPGGGYGGLADHEGKPVAEWLNSIGVTGLVLKYRLGPRYHHPVMMNDVNRAIRLEGTPMPAANQAVTELKVLVPADLPPLTYEVAVRAELLGADNRTVVASVTTPVRRLPASK